MTQRILSALAALLVFTLPGLSAATKGYPRGDALISVGELRDLVEAKDPKLVVLAHDNPVSFALGHVPGALQVDRPNYAADPATQNGVSGNILAVSDFTEFARSLGINEDSTVVIYDDDVDATRLWWAFTYYGKTNVRVLDGAYAAYKDAGFATEAGVSKTPAKGNFTARIAYPNLRIDTDELAALINDKPDQIQVWDARDYEEFTGAVTKSGAVRPGRLPSATFDTWTNYKTPGSKAAWKSYDEVAARLKELGYDKSKTQIFYCQSGVRSTTGIFTLYLAGWPLENLRNYDSSWIGWSRSTLPALSGPAN